MKLVRDKIPEIIKKKGGKPIFYVAGKQEYWNKLKEKLLEKTKEFFADENMEEMADILEVVEAMRLYKKFDKKKLEAIKKKKAKERGVFKKKIILEKSKLPMLKLGKYRHYKQKEYEVIGVARHSETMEDMVIYKPLYKSDSEFWVRPLAMFIENVEVDGKIMPRFEYIGE